MVLVQGNAGVGVVGIGARSEGGPEEVLDPRFPEGREGGVAGSGASFAEDRQV